MQKLDLDLLNWICKKSNIGLEQIQRVAPYALHHYFSKKDCKIDEINKILQLGDGYQFNKKDSYGNTPLYYYTNNSSIKYSILEYCLKRGANANAKNRYQITPFLNICLNLKNSNEMIKLFLKYGNTLENLTMFHHERFFSIYEALSKRFIEDSDFIKNLFTNSIVKNTNETYCENMIQIICELGDTYKFLLKHLFRVAINNNYQESIIINKIIYDSCRSSKKCDKILKFILKNVSDISLCEDSFDTFSEICNSKKININKERKILLKKGIDLNKRNNQGVYYLHEALANDRVSIRIIKLFLDLGANVDTQGILYREIPIHFAAKRKNPQIQLFKLLIERGADINSLNELNQNILHILLLTRKIFINFNLLKYLIKNGINILQKDRDSNTPLLLACKFCCSPKVISLLSNNPNISLIREKSSKMNALDHLIKISYQKDVTQHIYDIESSELLLKKHSINIKSIKNILSLSPNCLSLDFEKMFTLGELTDEKICGIKVHRMILELRTGKKFNEINTVLQFYTKEEINIFLHWVYSEKLTNKSLILEILGRLKIEFSQISHWKKILKKLYKDDNSKDFSIIINKKKKIKTHKFLLQARSDLYRGLFLFDNSDQWEINDYSGKSYETLSIFIRYLYYDSFSFLSFSKTSEKLSQIFSELQDCHNYFQLNINSLYVYDLKFSF
ncbi:ankyrin repeat-containing protein [Anaeramoeba flamelloides]|uniref:Ankyrin repeat-containing protein n=1 Tax=Anaeramoeba flamelloides TaxID=1746091 RepID=A0ABQ8YF09_9EUKA|nr:ankyrin repeat-containing protein [Anaeramoeba flamelloides]